MEEARVEIPLPAIRPLLALAGAPVEILLAMNQSVGAPRQPASPGLFPGPGDRSGLIGHASRPAEVSPAPQAGEALRGQARWRRHRTQPQPPVSMEGEAWFNLDRF